MICTQIMKPGQHSFAVPEKSKLIELVAIMGGYESEIKLMDKRSWKWNRKPNIFGFPVFYCFYNNKNTIRFPILPADNIKIKIIYEIIESEPAAED